MLTFISNSYNYKMHRQTALTPTSAPYPIKTAKTQEGEGCGLSVDWGFGQYLAVDLGIWTNISCRFGDL